MMKIQKFKNITSRNITVFLKNAKPIKFRVGQTISIPSTDLHIKYKNYIALVKEPVVEEVIKPEIKEKELLSEVKQPAEDKILIKEPVNEDTKSEKKVLTETKTADVPKKKTGKKKSGKYNYTKSTESKKVGSISED